MLEKLKKALASLLKKNPEPPEDPHVSVRVPVKRGPPGRTAAIALDEPEE